MLKKYVILLFALIISVATELSAQLKELSTDQMLNRKTEGILNPLPKFLGWENDTHYILIKNKDTVSVDVKSGKETKYIKKSMDKFRVITKKDDIFLVGANGFETQITNTAAIEKNPTLSPDNLKIAFTRDNDLYVIEIASGKEIRLTTDGSDVVYNGYASWVYYEEILGRASHYRAFWWNPDSKRIAYMHFNDEEVPMFPITNYFAQPDSTEETRYPKAGDKNPEVKVGVVDIETKKTVWSDFNEKDDQYFGTPYWTPDGNALWMQWMDRHQNRLIIYTVNPATGNKEPIYNESQKTWVDWKEEIYFLNNNKGFILMSDVSGWMHIYHYDMKGNLIKQITSGAWTVKEIEAINESKGSIYFTGRKENSTRFDLYKVSMDGSKFERLTFGEYTHSVNLSPDQNYFITTYSNVSTPSKMALLNNNGKLLKAIADSKGPEFDTYKLAKTELLRVKTSDGFELPVLITWPLNLDSSKKYPVLINIYGGPNAGTVYDGWKGINQNQWWAKEGIIQMAIDHRGSGHFGKMGQNYLYKDLGNWEIKDYSTVVQWLTAMPFANQSKVCITGFSYGGYITSMALTRGAAYFTHGIAGGSVTDWHLYDSHYTERYMGLPKENAEGYKSSSVFTYVDKYKGDLYLVHGTMDDNVHLQNTIQLAGILQDAKKDFEMMLYPGGRHGWANLKNRWAHFNNEKAKYYYEKLLEKPVNPEIIK